MNKHNSRQCAKYLHRVNPKRYQWEKLEDYMHLVDMYSGKRHHSRDATKYTSLISYFGRVPICSFYIGVD